MQGSVTPAQPVDPPHPASASAASLARRFRRPLALPACGTLPLSTPHDRSSPPRLPGDPGLLPGRAPGPLRPRRAEAGRRVPEEAPRPPDPGDDLHEGVAPHPRVVRAGDLPAGRPRALPLAARRPA